MTFVGRYELGDLLLTTRVETFSALDLKDQARVLVHVFPATEHRLGAADPPQAVIDRFVELTGAPPTIARGAAVDPATGFAYVVTDELPQETISGWGRSSAVGAAPSGAAAPGVSGIFSVQPEDGPASSAPNAAPESVTKEFMPGMLAAEAQRRPESAIESGKPETAGPSSGDPGAFTRMFGTPGARLSKEGDSVGLAAGSSGVGPGAFTKVFGIPGAQPSKDEPQPAISARGTSGAGPGAFTKMFGSPGAQPSKDEPQPAISAPGTSGASPGAFTKMFGSPDAHASKDEPQPRTSAAGTSGAAAGPFTRMFANATTPNPPATQQVDGAGFDTSQEASALQGSPGPLSNVFPGEHRPQPAPGLSSPDSGDQVRRTQPGSFTRMFGSPGAAPPMSSDNAGSLPGVAAAPNPPASSDGPFTSLFGQGKRADNRPFVHPEPTSDAVQGRPPFPQSAPDAANAAPVPPLSSAEPPARTTPGSSTQFFRGGISQPPAAAAIPSGPSEYTRVISLRSISPAAPQPPSSPAMPPGTPSPTPPVPPQFPVAPFGGQAPPPPYFPAPVPAPPMPPVIPMPQVGFPGAPGMPVPQPPPMPNLGWPQAGGPQVPNSPPAQASSRRSWLPLILIFNALFVLAVIVILLFALKGH